MAEIARKVLIMINNLQQMRLIIFSKKVSWKRVIQKTAEATGDLIGNKIADAVLPKTLDMRAKSYNGKTDKHFKKFLTK